MIKVAEDPRIHRRLAASWPGCCHDIPEYRLLRETFLEHIARAFPEITDGLDVVVIWSMRRRWDVLELSASNRVIVVDLAYSSMLERFDDIAGNKEIPVSHIALLERAMFAWSLFVAGDYERASVIAAHVVRDPVEPALWMTKARQPEFLLFTILHEAAHAIVDSQGTLADDASKYASVSIKNTADRLKDIVQALEAIRTTKPTVDTPEDMASVADYRLHLIRQHELNALNDELPREVACDFLALLGIVRFYFQLDLLSENAEPLSIPDFRAFSEVLLTSVRTVVIMTEISIMRQDATALRDKAKVNEVYDFFAEQQMRLNIAKCTALRFIEVVPLTLFGEQLRQAVLDAFREKFDKYRSTLLSRLGAARDAKNLLRDETMYAPYREQVWSDILETVTNFNIAETDEVGIAQFFVDILPIDGPSSDTSGMTA